MRTVSLLLLTVGLADSTLLGQPGPDEAAAIKALEKLKAKFICDDKASGKPIIEVNL